MSHYVSSLVTRGFQRLSDEGYPTNVIAKLNLEGELVEKVFIDKLRETLWTFDKFHCHIDNSNWVYNKQDMLEDHVQKHTFKTLGYEKLNDFISTHSAKPFKNNTSPWMVYVCTDTVNTVVIFVLSHVLGDGITLSCILGMLTDPVNPEEDFFAMAHKWKPKVKKQSTESFHIRVYNMIVTTLAFLYSLLCAVVKVLILPFGFSDSNHLLKCNQSKLSLDKRCAFSKKSLLLSDIRSYCKRKQCGYTINDILQTSTSLGIKKYINNKNNNKNNDKNNNTNGRFFTVVNLRAVYSQKDAEDVLEDFKNVSYDCNSFSYVISPLLLDTTSNAQKLSKMSSHMHQLKTSPEPYAILYILKSLAIIGDFLACQINKMSQNKMSGFISNTPGPQLPLKLCNCTITSIINCVTPCAFSIGISFLSYNNQIDLGICTDSSVCDEPQELVNCIMESVKEIIY